MFDLQRIGGEKPCWGNPANSGRSRDFLDTTTSSSTFVSGTDTGLSGGTSIDLGQNSTGSLLSLDWPSTGGHDRLAFFQFLVKRRSLSSPWQAAIRDIESCGTLRK
jgi:hypothetical protein